MDQFVRFRSQLPILGQAPRLVVTNVQVLCHVERYWYEWVCILNLSFFVTILLGKY